jgi:hypothetical protein
MAGLNSVIYAVEVVRDLDHGSTVQFVARLPMRFVLSPEDELKLKRRLHDGMQAALAPLFEMPDAKGRSDLP